METRKFSTVTKGNGYLVAGDVIFAGYYRAVRHASPTKPQDSFINSSGIETVASSDRDLLKLWNHATIERKYGVYASKDLLKKELEDRGYVLTENQHRWKKTEIAA